MSWTVPVALYGFVPFVAMAFAATTPARAVLVSYLAGWLFLPVAGFELFGFLDYTKSTAVPLVVLLAIAFFDSARLMRFRFGWIDLPIAALCAAPFAASIANDLGWYDGLSGTAYQTLIWGVPYLTGRLYFSSPAGLRLLAIGVLAGGLLYAPLCWWEIRMSPQLHAEVYGFHQHDWVQTLRSGGYRPMVFMHHGLMLGLWMTCCSIVGLALWWSGSLRRLCGVPLALAVPLLIVTAILCKSFGALALFAAGAAALAAMCSLRTSLPMAVLACVPAAYVATRATGLWAGAGIVELVKEVDSDRAGSLSFRLSAEDDVLDKATEKPLLGWGGWGRSLVASRSNPLHREEVTIDSLWMLEFGKHGWLGLGSLLLVFLTPVVVLWRRSPPRLWARAGTAIPWALALAFTLYALDSLVNAMVNPLYLLIGGGLCGLSPAVAAVTARASRVTRASVLPARAAPSPGAEVGLR